MYHNKLLLNSYLIQIITQKDQLGNNNAFKINLKHVNYVISDTFTITYYVVRFLFEKKKSNGMCRTERSRNVLLLS